MLDLPELMTIQWICLLWYNTNVIFFAELIFLLFIMWCCKILSKHCKNGKSLYKWKKKLFETRIIINFNIYGTCCSEFFTFLTTWTYSIPYTIFMAEFIHLPIFIFCLLFLLKRNQASFNIKVPVVVCQHILNDRFLQIGLFS